MILTAGFSRRLPGENKLLKDYAGQPLVAHVLTTVSELGLGEVVVVTGCDAAKITRLAEQVGLASTCNESAEEGMGSSIAAGTKELSENLSGLFVVLGDMPFVQAVNFHRLAAAHQNCARRICVPVWQGKRGHPVLFGTRYRPELAQLSGDVGARSTLHRHRDEVVDVPAVSNGVLVDFDTGDDFAKASAGEK